MELINLSRRFSRYFLKLGYCLVIAAISCSVANAASKYSSADKLKAAFLFNFANLIKWPATFNSRELERFYICTGKGSSVGQALSKYAGKTVDGKVLTVLQLTSFDDPGRCQILYLDEYEVKTLELAKAKKASPSTLLVSNAEGFTGCYGHIEFVEGKQTKKLSLSVNLTNTNKSDLQVSSRILVRSKVHKATECSG